MHAEAEESEVKSDMPYLRIQIGRLFSVEPQLTVHLIRLMAAANDFNTVMSSILERLPEQEDPTAELRIKGERIYLFRLASGHLHEAIQVLKQLGKDCPHVLQATPPELELEKIYNRIAVTAYPLEGNLARLRHHAIFHYDDSELVGVLREWGPDAEGEILIGENLAQTRHSVADEAFSTEIRRIFRFPSDREEGKRAFGNLINQLFPLQIDLMEYVLGLLYTVRELDPEMIQVLEE